MNFIDKVLVDVAAGNGGNGSVSFRHEKFVDRGGPDGGDGGHGGNVIFVGSRNQNTLAAFRYQREVRAEHGQAGSKRRKHGKTGKDLRVMVPVGTVISTEEGVILADLSADGTEAVIAKGGRGGFGNAHFVSSVRQAPRFAEKGELGEAFILRLELKMIADVGLVGLPNAGKSTLLAASSNARPEIADYPFTTLRPNLGIVTIDDKTTVLVADIPGLIAGASAGRGLGHEFLRHVERTKVLLHMVDAYNEDLAGAYATIQAELAAYKVDLTDRQQVIAINKTDGMDEEMIDDLISQLKTVAPEGTVIRAVSAQSGHGIKQLFYDIKAALDAYKAEHVEDDTPAVPVIRLRDDSLAWRVSKQPGNGGFLVTGNKIEKFAARTEFTNEEGVARLRDIMRKMGIMHELVRQGVESDQRVSVGGHGSFLY